MCIKCHFLPQICWQCNTGSYLTNIDAVINIFFKVSKAFEQSLYQYQGVFFCVN